MFVVKYCPTWNYYPQAVSLSAAINQGLPDTCEIEEGSKGQFDLFHNGNILLSKAAMGRFPTIEDIDYELIESLYK